jgi:hypothetical protein
MKKNILMISFIAISSTMAAQNVGIGITTPSGKLHIKGSADTTQFIIDANSTQSNTRPLIKLRNSAGADLMWIHSDDGTNTFAGLNAGRVNNASGGGVFNTFIGSNAGYSNTSGGYNTAIGNTALYSNTTGNGNTANGYNALGLNSTGYSNTANGYDALFADSTGYENTASGAFALVSNSNGFGNTANGTNALSTNRTGFENVATGHNALSSNISGFANTAIGAYALRYNIGGTFNIAIGYDAGNLPNAPNINNSAGIGNNGYLLGSSNTVILGNASTTFIGGAVGFTNQSDARIKNTIVEDVKGLDFILRLRPVTYHVSLKAIKAITGNKETPDFPGKYDGEKVKYSGFLAQEVEQAAKTSGYDFSGVYIPEKSTQLYGLRYAEFVVPLVKAVQELSEQTVAEKKIIGQQQQKINDLEKRMEIMEKIISKQ